MGFIEFNHVVKSYSGDVKVIDDITLSIERGEFVTIVGPSGCGKTTLLKMVNKLIPISQGNIYIDGKDVIDWETISLRRSIGYVIQHIGLLPHLNIEDNINYVPSISKRKSGIDKNRAKELIELVGLSDDYLSRYPRQLSGGQMQRIGVARALTADPEIILMDEPFGAVDEIARTQLQHEIKEIHKKLKKTILFVTHDIQEALKLGTKIVLLKNGKIEQIGTQEELVFKPKSEYVKAFFGLKGFQASLNENVMHNVYNRILLKQETLDGIYRKLE
ncbi:ATP-binding cassette domain-containing protein [Alkalibaculum sp. M08DMB]|uniref:ABC-type quaternary amine transporter n=1 Tax=Alkalibaculum sporogenes TaxID=2655001 RepID=A0A6A7KCN7_9FIRM|nr:ABC transporter ATP-binding protein [Alkalibaculum sporogenes]MPW27166.1 ATP-binding cassette domain-containing protein [Alkalibaculum sporogenes]